MAVELYMMKKLGALRPLGPIDGERLDELPEGVPVRVKASRSRSGPHHRLFFAALALIHRNQSHYVSVDQLLNAVKVELGYVEWFKMRDGREIGIPQSISYDKMDQAEFDKFFNRFCDLVQTKIIPGLRQADLERELREMGVAA